MTVSVSDPMQLLNHHSIAVTFTDHQKLLQSLRLPYSARQLLNYVGKYFPGQRLAFAYEAGPTGFGLCDELLAAGHVCLVVAPPMVPRASGQRVKTNRLDIGKKRDGVIEGFDHDADVVHPRKSHIISSFVTGNVRHLRYTWYNARHQRQAPVQRSMRGTLMRESAACRW